MGDGKFVEQLGAQGMKLVSDGVQMLSPRDLHFLIQQLLRPGEILDSGKAVVLTHIPQAFTSIWHASYSRPF